MVRIFFFFWQALRGVAAILLLGLLGLLAVALVTYLSEVQKKNRGGAKCVFGKPSGLGMRENFGHCDRSTEVVTSYSGLNMKGKAHGKKALPKIRKAVMLIFLRYQWRCLGHIFYL